MEHRTCYLSALLFFALLLTGCLPRYSIGTATGSSSYISEDRRTSGMFIEDESIELKSSRRLYQQFGNVAHVNITSFNRIVLLTGEAPSENAKVEIEKLIMGVDNVRKIHNEITVASNSSLASRSNDTLITSKVKARFLAERKFQINHVKIVTENGVVYLLGMVTHQEADDASKIASSTAGVRKVVRVFEYLN